MKCPHPITLKGDNSHEAQLTRMLEGKNQFQGPYTVPCGRCYACLGSRRSSWAFRLHAESMATDTVDTLFITLTYDESALAARSFLLCKKDLQALFKRLRKNGNHFKYYAIGEYGTHTQRAHYHAMVFLKAVKDNEGNVDITDRVKFVHNLQFYWQEFECRRPTGKSLGFIKVDSISPARVNYVLHYHVRPKEIPDSCPQVYGYDKKGNLKREGKPFAISSQGLGVEFFQSPGVQEKLNSDPDNYLISDMLYHRSVLPRYYRKKFGLVSLDQKIDSSPWQDIPKKYAKRNDYNYLFSYRDFMKRKFLKYNLQEKF